MYSKMDINKIFNSFSEEDDNVASVDFSEHPIYLLGMFRKLITSHKLYGLKNILSIVNVIPDIDKDDIKSIGDFILFNRAWDYINKIDIINETHIQIVKDSHSNQLVDAIDCAISYFETKEEYEKCAYLFNIKKLLLTSVE